MKKFFIALFGLVILGGAGAHAATINVDPGALDDTAFVTVIGDLEPGDGKRFRTRTLGLSKAIVAFHSKGGPVVAGIEIGRLIRMRGWATFVPDGALCASACAIAWLAGAPRAMGRHALIGFHAAYNPKTGRESGMANALVGAYLNELGLPPAAIMYVTVAEPDSMLWLNPDEARKVGIQVATLNPEPPRPSLAEKSSALRTRAINFVTALYKEISRAPPDLLANLGALYASEVNYYGKRLPQREVLEQIERFFERWPTRTYTPKSADADCNAADMTCSVTGVLAFDAESQTRNKRSYGTASFSYLLQFNHSGAVKILSETGKVLEREVVDLPPPFILPFGRNTGR